MKKNVSLCLILLVIPILLFGCGDENASPGLVTVRVTDAKPYLPEEVEQVLITFDEVLVHKSGGGWISLPLYESPYTIDLKLFYNGLTTELVPPMVLDSGKYTQLRLGITEGSVVTATGSHPLNIPSQYLKTNKNFIFDVQSGEAVDLTIDFDLSQSLKALNPSGFQPKPVLHLNETHRAAQIRGSIASGTFVDSEAVVIVTLGGEEYTRLRVSQADPVDPTDFRIFWLVPYNDYYVEILTDGIQVYDEDVEASALGAGAVLLLNGGAAI